MRDIVAEATRQAVMEEAAWRGDSIPKVEAEEARRAASAAFVAELDTEWPTNDSVYLAAYNAAADYLRAFGV